MRQKKAGYRPLSEGLGQPFDSVEEAWAWAVAGASARLAGARVTAGLARIERPCEPFDVIRIAWRLYRQRRLNRNQVNALLNDGEAQDVVKIRGGHISDLDQALDILITPLRERGILA
ncbi:MAG: hypothetical protein JKY20_04035 [Alphaproteobacteria bacterium]|nr:hypothetical protein [Alphaproteobacteria bacterium]